LPPWVFEYVAGHLLVGVVSMALLAFVLALCSEADAFVAASLTMVLLLGVRVALIAATGAYTRYVEPTMVPWLFGSAGVLITLALIVIARDLRAGHAIGRGGHADRGRIVWLPAQPIVPLTLVVPPALNARAAAPTTVMATSRPFTMKDVEHVGLAKIVIVCCSALSTPSGPSRGAHRAGITRQHLGACGGHGAARPALHGDVIDSDARGNERYSHRSAREHLRVLNTSITRGGPVQRPPGGSKSAIPGSRLRWVVEIQVVVYGADVVGCAPACMQTSRARYNSPDIVDTSAHPGGRQVEGAIRRGSINEDAQRRRRCRYFVVGGMLRWRDGHAHNHFDDEFVGGSVHIHHRSNPCDQPTGAFGIECPRSDRARIALAGCPAAEHGLRWHLRGTGALLDRSRRAGESH
jgi:hypothetical protein